MRALIAASDTSNEIAEPLIAKRTSKQLSKSFCIYCMADNAIDPVVTECGHLSCWTCLLEYTEMNGQYCGLCRKAIKLQYVISIH